MNTINPKHIERVRNLLNKKPQSLKTLSRKTGFSRNKVNRIIDRLFDDKTIFVRYAMVREGERGTESVAYYV